MTKGSDLLVAALENEGVERIFGIPGEENLDVVESLRHSRIELVLTRHEQAAGFMAATYGRLTGRPGVCITTLGPGALNLTTAAAYRPPRRDADGDDHRAEGHPVVAPGALPDRRHRRGDEAADQAGAPDRRRPARSRRWCARPSASRRRSGPGPVLLELPEDIAGEECEAVPHGAAASARAAGRQRRRRSIAPPAMIVAAERPLVMLGAAASRPRSSADLAQFVLRTRIPYFTTQMGKGTVPGGTELYMGTAALSERDYVHDAIEQADLIVTIGHDTSEKPPFLMDDDRPQVIHVGYQPATVEQVYFPQAEVVGDIGRSLCLLADRLEGKLPNAGALLPLREGILAHLADRATEDRWTPQRIVHDVRQVMPADGIVALDNGMYKIWFARNYRTRAANTLLLDNALATMGAGLPSAIMAAMLYPQAARPRRLRRRRLHDEQPGAGDRGAAASSTWWCWCWSTTPSA